MAACISLSSGPRMVLFYCCCRCWCRRCRCCCCAVSLSSRCRGRDSTYVADGLLLRRGCSREKRSDPMGGQPHGEGVPCSPCSHAAHAHGHLTRLLSVSPTRPHGSAHRTAVHGCPFLLSAAEEVSFDRPEGEGQSRATLQILINLTSASSLPRARALSLVPSGGPWGAGGRGADLLPSMTLFDIGKHDQYPASRMTRSVHSLIV